MNRRSFLKLVGVSAVAAVLPIPEVLAEEVSQIVIPECPGCAAGLPKRERLGWRVIEPMGIIILNDNAITKIALTGA